MRITRRVTMSPEPGEYRVFADRPQPELGIRQGPMATTIARARHLLAVEFAAPDHERRAGDLAPQWPIRPRHRRVIEHHNADAPVS
jgi:hypothetical protein